MRRVYGLAPLEAVSLLVNLDTRRRTYGDTFLYFMDDKIRAMQSFNRSIEEIRDMAAKAKAKIAQKPMKREEFVWQGFVQCKMSDSDKANFAQWDIQDNDVWEGVSQYAVAGYKITIIYAPNNKSFTASMTGQPECGDNHGWCVNAFAADPYNAVRAMLYKVTAMLPEIWSEYEADPSDLLG